MSIEIVSGPEQLDVEGIGPKGEDGVVWAWKVRDQGHERTIKVIVSGTAVATEPDTLLSDETRRVIETRGRSAIEVYVTRKQEIPDTLLFSTHGGES